MVIFASSFCISQSQVKTKHHTVYEIQLLQAGSPEMSVLLPLERSGNESSDPLDLEASG